MVSIISIIKYGTIAFIALAIAAPQRVAEAGKGLANLASGLSTAVASPFIGVAQGIGALGGTFLSGLQGFFNIIPGVSVVPGTEGTGTDATGQVQAQVTLPGAAEPLGWTSLAPGLGMYEGIPWWMRLGPGGSIISLGEYITGLTAPPAGSTTTVPQNTEDPIDRKQTTVSTPGVFARTGPLSSTAPAEERAAMLKQLEESLAGGAGGYF